MPESEIDNLILSMMLTFKVPVDCKADKNQAENDCEIVDCVHFMPLETS